MRKNLPSLESVLTDEYWANPLDPPDKEALRIWKDQSLQSQISDLAGKAAAGILTGQPREHLADGTSLNPDTNPILQEGSLLLMDLEAAGTLEKSARLHIKDESSQPIFRRRKISDEAELQSSTGSIFCLNSETLDLTGGLQTVIYPYRKGIFNRPGTTYYSRVVQLVAVAPAKNEGTLLQTVSMYDYNEGDLDIVGDITSFPRRETVIDQLMVGEVYNLSGFRVRVSSAEICLNGTLEYARQRRKSRRSFFIGRLATAPNFS